MDAIRSVSPSRRNPYIVETSLSILRPRRLRQLSETNCAVVAPGIESWGGYAAKAGVGRVSPVAKARAVADHVNLLHEHIPYVQVNFIYGLDADAAIDRVALMKTFFTETPRAWPVVNLPYPFGGTPLYQRYRREGRILTKLPFAFYYSPHLAVVPNAITPDRFYEELIDIYHAFTSVRMLKRRLASTRSPMVGLIHAVRTAVKRKRLTQLRQILALLRKDRLFRRFHEEDSGPVPDYYHEALARQLGRYASLFAPDELIPVHEPAQ
jgi:hypothetical protein